MKFSGWIAVTTKSRVTFGADPHRIPHYQISILPLCRRYAVSRMPFYLLLWWSFVVSCFGICLNARIADSESFYSGDISRERLLYIGLCRNVAVAYSCLAETLFVVSRRRVETVVDCRVPKLVITVRSYALSALECVNTMAQTRVPLICLR